MAVDYTGCTCGSSGGPGGSDCVTCQTIQLCDTVTTGGTDPETPERIVNGNFATGTAANPGPTTAPPWVLTPDAQWLPAAGQDGQVGFIDLSPGNGFAGTIEQTVTVTPGLTYNLSALLGTWDTGGEVPQSVTVEVRDGANTLLFGQTYNPAVVPGQRVWNLNVGPAPIVATDGTMTVRFIDNVGGNFTDALVDNVSLLGPGAPGTGGATTVVPFLRTVCRNCNGTIASQTDTELDGTTPFVHDPAAVTGVCTSSAADGCARQVVERCGCDDVNGDGSVINRYIELWSVDPCNGGAPELIGTWIDGDFDQPYTVVNPIDCPDVPECNDCETQQLCDVQSDMSAVLPAFGESTEAWHDLANGVRWMRRGNDGALPGGWFLADASTPERFDFDRPVEIVYTVRFSGPTAAPLRIPAGWYLDSINTGQHAWNPDTRTLSPTASATQAGLSTFRIESPTAQIMFAPVVVGTQPSGQTSQYGQITVTADFVTPFLRTVCRACDGTVNSVTDTTLDGQTAYAILGAADRCQDAEHHPCNDCQSFVLCDDGVDDPATIFTTTATGTLPNGVTYTVTASSGTVTAPVTNSEGAWWGRSESFPNVQVGPYTLALSQPAVVEFSVYAQYHANPSEADDNDIIVPAGSIPVYLPPGFTYNTVTNTVTVGPDQQNVGDAAFANPSRALSARFRTAGEASSVRVEYRGPRFASGGQFRTYLFGAIEVAPRGQFLRTICKDCNGAVTSVRDTRLDGVTAYTPRGAAKQCGAEAADTLLDCEYLILCDTLPAVTAIPTTDLEWALSGNVTRAPAGGGFPPRFNFNGDPVNGVVTRTFSVAADDSYTISWADAWNGSGTVGGVPGTANAKYTLDVLDAATNAVLQSSGQINVTNGSTSSAGVSTDRNLTFTAPASGSVIVRITDQTDPEPNNRDLWLFTQLLTNQDPAGDQVTFLRRYCTSADGAVSTTDTDFNGVTPYEVRGFATACATDGVDIERTRMCVINPLSGNTQTGYVYRVNGYSTRDGSLVFSRLENADGTAFTGGPANVRECQDAAVDNTVSTGVARYTDTDAHQATVTGTGTVQTVTLTVLTGNVQTVTPNGSAVIPAGVTVTWSVSDTDDLSLSGNGPTFTGEAGSDYLLNWTTKPGALG